MIKCPHEKVSCQNNRCLFCGAQISSYDISQHFKQVNGLYVNTSISTKKDAKLMKELVSKQKVVVIMDIDNTMLHCLGYVEDNVAYRNMPKDRINQMTVQKVFTEQYKHDYVEYYRFLAQNEYCDLVSGQSGANTTVYTIAFRPGIFRFLLSLRNYATFRISTTGNRQYAEQILAVLDPDRKIFGTVVTRDEQSTYKQPLYGKYISLNENSDLDYRKHFDGFSDDILARTVAIDDNTLVWSNEGKRARCVLKSLVFIQSQDDIKAFWTNQAMTFFPENNAQVDERTQRYVKRLNLNYAYRIQLESFQNIIKQLAVTPNLDISSELTKLRNQIFYNCVFVTYYDTELLDFYKKISQEFNFQLVTNTQYQELLVQSEQHSNKISQQDSQIKDLQIYHLIPSKMQLVNNDVIMKKLQDSKQHIDFKTIQKDIQDANNNLKYKYYVYGQDYRIENVESISNAKQFYDSLGLKIVNLEYLLLSLYLLKRQDDFYWFINFGAQFLYD